MAATDRESTEPRASDSSGGFRLGYVSVLSGCVGVVANGVTTLYMDADLMTAELAERDVDVQQAYEVDVLKRFKVTFVRYIREAVATSGW